MYKFLKYNLGGTAEIDDVKFEKWSLKFLPYHAPSTNRAPRLVANPIYEIGQVALFLLKFRNSGIDNRTSQTRVHGRGGIENKLDGTLVAFARSRKSS